ncbi:hypothetical protein COL91_26165 [Bacillus pseudomycoides]|nr:hypothetical protein COO02_14425 [Bacillus pseudomycoides]PEI86860.1 hypothetical protein CN679_23025 [Bacillus pseudomycoides]PGA83820.1 hypothetical protein COL91_26165 [Bacillus pseudomycoides]PHF35753.1 hypothetical protein COF72_25055 [Bacillus pseudomycoides]
MNCTPNRGHLKKVHDSGFFCVFALIPRYNGNNDKSEVREMSKIIFNEIQMKQLEKNKNVVKVSERSITGSGAKIK